jgi:hypothetical protein
VIEIGEMLRLWLQGLGFQEVARLSGTTALVRRHGAAAVDDACRRALDTEVIDVGAHRPHVLPRHGRAVAAAVDTTTGGIQVRPGGHRLRGAEAIMSPARPDATPAAKPIEVSADLKSLMRRLKVGQLLDTLPTRYSPSAATTPPTAPRSASPGPHPDPPYPGAPTCRRSPHRLAGHLRYSAALRIPYSCTPPGTPAGTCLAVTSSTPP